MKCKTGKESPDATEMTLARDLIRLWYDSQVTEAPTKASSLPLCCRAGHRQLQPLLSHAEEDSKVLGHAVDPCAVPPVVFVQHDVAVGVLAAHNNHTEENPASSGRGR